MSQVPSSTLDGLPKQFVQAMRTLFDIMDDKHTGYVNFADIENRWQDDGTKGLPKGVIESLQKVTPANGLLSFERFCAGLKICLLRNQVDNRKPSGKLRVVLDGANPQPIRPPSAPLLDIDGGSGANSSSQTSCNKSQWGAANTAAIRPNNAMPQHRTLSMPQLSKDALSPAGDGDQRTPTYADPLKPVPNVNKQLYGPPKPPRSAVNLQQIQTDRNLDRAEIRTALQNWQMGIMMNDQENKLDKRLGYPSSGLLDGRGSGRGAGDGKPAVQTEMQNGLYQKKANVRRREPRRHTLQNGIDYNMLKKMKQIEQEKDVLMQGLQAIEKARDWYLKQVAAVQEKMKYLGRMGSHMEHWTEAQQERLELQRARVLEVNRHLATLTDSWERGGLPLHMNLAVHHHNQQPSASHEMLSRLKQQNHLLTEEVSKKSERITALEREKASLIRELFQTRAQTRNNGQEEAVF